jgi:hypothetical protein
VTIQIGAFCVAETDGVEKDIWARAAGRQKSATNGGRQARIRLDELMMEISSRIAFHYYRRRTGADALRGG